MSGAGKQTQPATAIAYRRLGSRKVSKRDDDKQPSEVRCLEIVGWSDHLHPDITRKVKPPFRWVKLQSENLDMLGDLTLREFGAFSRLILLAALTNNVTVWKPNWIKRRTGVTQKDIEKLQNRGLVRIVWKSGTLEESQQIQDNRSNTASGPQAHQQQSAGTEGRGRDRSRFDKRGLDDSQPPDVLNTDSPAPTPSKSNGHDPRSFDNLKIQVLSVARKLGSKDPNQIYRLAGQSLRMSSKQIGTAVKQLIEDRRL